MRQLVTNTNREIAALREEVRKLQRTPKITGPLDMGGHRIVNVGRTKDQDDVPNRGELIDKAMYDNGSGQHVARSPIIATSGIRSKRLAKEPDELITLRAVQDIAGTSGGGTFVTTNTLQNITGQKILDGKLNFTFTPLTGVLNGNANHNIALSDHTFFVIRTGPSANFGFTGFFTPAGTPDGRLVILFNATAFNMTILNENASSLATNRIQTLSTGGANMVTTGPGVIWMVYDSTALRWVIVATNL